MYRTDCYHFARRGVSGATWSAIEQVIPNTGIANGVLNIGKQYWLILRNVYGICKITREEMPIRKKHSNLKVGVELVFGELVITHQQLALVMIDISER